MTVSDERIGEGSFGVVLAGMLDIGGGRSLRVAVLDFNIDARWVLNLDESGIFYGKKTNGWTLPAVTRAEERQQFEKELKAHIMWHGTASACACSSAPAK